ncbi:family 10 glycosylhydrolase [Clostridium amazonitimonense]|uniref:family 10 glycosylhydrolase n=1 Tax=Clostridium amazonitimonense TaxID=1499689 RepID=UPI00068E36D1|nr:family 10 glycosylhydrolase [Clostridium amazonitimonense]
MKIKKFLRNIALAMTLTLSISTLFAKKTFAEEELVPIHKFGTKDPILLHHKEIKIPKNFTHPKEQFRSTWVSTVSNLDFPSKQGLTEAEFKKEYLKVLEDFEALNLNAVTFQVRPMNDAFYKSDLNPWSVFLTGEQGKDPGWDPMPWMIEETHKRNMEFHAWFNPYRVSHAFDWKKPTEQVLEEELAKLSDDNFAKKHPEYLIRFDNKLILDPALPEVQKFVEDSILEVVKKYDVDAIHFDDYFYPYKVTREGNPVIFGDKEEDKSSFEKYGKDFEDIKDFRRDNVNNLIKNISKSIKSEKPYVKFGISPFGIWGHYEVHPGGSPEGDGSHTPVDSTASYDDNYADTRKWVKEGWIDYITPQIYWAFSTTAAPYGEIADWWAEVVKGTNCHLYVGHPNYKHIDAKWDKDWHNPEEIPNQLKFNTMYKSIKGSSFFSLKHLRTNELGVTDVMREQYFNTKAIVPAMPWIDNKAPNSPLELAVNKIDSGLELTWKDDANNDSSYYVVYRFEGDKLGNTNDSSNIVAKVRRTDNNMQFIDKDADSSKAYVYAVTSLDRIHNESAVTEVSYELDATPVTPDTGDKDSSEDNAIETPADSTDSTDNTGSDSTTNNNTTEPSKIISSKLPKTGSPIGTSAALLLGLTSILTGTVLRKRK